MCGIFGYVGAGNATDIIFAGLKKLEYRGYDSWGIAIGVGDILRIEKHVGKIGDAKVRLPKSHIGIGHTRWATHGGVTRENAHPHQDCTGQIAVVHNGIIENYELLKKSLLAKGHTFRSETDTEVFAHLVEEEMKQYDFVTAVQKSAKLIRGLSTFVVMDQVGTLVACKNGSPLVVGQSEQGELFISSDIPSLLAYTNRVAVIGDGETVVIQKGKLLTPLTFETINMENEQAELGSFSHYLRKEIADQGAALLRLALVQDPATTAAQKLLKQAKQIYAIGCGTAFNSQLVAMYLFAKYLGKQIIPISANEFASFAPLVNKDTVVLMASQSGETIDTIEAMRQAKHQGAATIALINVPGSTLAREVDVVIPLRAGVERAVVSTKAFTNMVAGILLILGQQDLVVTASRLIKQMLGSGLEASIKTLVPRLTAHKHIFLVGRGINYPIALEGALKLKETAYIHAEGFAGGELKHGVIALIEKGTPCIVLVAEDEEKNSTLSGAMELKARGAWIIGIGPKREQVFDDWIQVPDNRALSPLLNIVPLQLLGYHLAVAKGLDPDMPRNLAKSVTVK